MNTEPLGDNRLNLYLRRRHEATILDRQAARIARDTLPEAPLATRGTAGGDERKLRGIPAIGRGVTGAIPGTIPHTLR